MLIQLALIFLGAGLGGMTRHGVSVLVHRAFNPSFPVSTVVVNVAGSLLMGVLIGVLAHKGASGHLWRPLLATGFLGGFTTFSTFSMEAILLWERGQPLAGAGYVLGSVVLGLLGLIAGLSLTRHLL